MTASSRCYTFNELFLLVCYLRRTAEEMRRGEFSNLFLWSRPCNRKELLLAVRTVGRMRFLVRTERRIIASLHCKILARP